MGVLFFRFEILYLEKAVSDIFWCSRVILVKVNGPHRSLDIFYCLIKNITVVIIFFVLVESEYKDEQKTLSAV